MLRLFILVSFLSSVALGTWVSNARLKDANNYYVNVMQETILELERREWSSLKLLNITQTLNEQMYNWLVTGEVTYTNGFLVSIQKLELVNIQSHIGNRLVDNQTTTVATVQGTLNMRDVIIGYDVIANLTNEGIQHYTGTYLHILIQMAVRIEKNLHLGTMDVSARVSSLSGGLHRMEYRPANSVTEVLSRRYVAGNSWDGISKWGIDTMDPIIMDIVTNRIPFPDVCFRNC